MIRNIMQISSANTQANKPTFGLRKYSEPFSNRITNTVMPQAKEVLGIKGDLSEEKLEKKVRFLAKQAFRMLAPRIKASSPAGKEAYEERAESALFKARMGTAREGVGFVRKLFDDVNKVRQEKIERLREKIQQSKARRLENKAKSIQKAVEQQPSIDVQRARELLKSLETKVRKDYAEKHGTNAKPPSGLKVKTLIRREAKNLPQQDREIVLRYQAHQAAKAKTKEKVRTRRLLDQQRRAKRAANQKPTTTQEIQQSPNPIEQIRSMRAYLLKNGSSGRRIPKPKPKHASATSKTQEKSNIFMQSGGRARLRELEAKLGVGGE